MDLYLSNKLKIASFLLIILIVVLHSNNLNINFQTGSYFINDPFNFWLQNFISDGICRIAVPLFFMISGYLFFMDVQGKFSLSDYKQKLWKRTWSIAIPFLIWSSLGILLLSVLQVFPGSRLYFSKHIIKDLDAAGFLDLWLVHPINYQLWFLQVLFLMVVISPFIFMLVKYLKLVLLLLLPLLWVGVMISFSGIVISDGFVYFTIGSLIAIDRINILSNLNKWHLLLIFVIWMFLLLLKVYFQTSYFEVSQAIGRFSIVPGVIFFWYGLDRIYNKFMDIHENTNILSFSFIIFVAHEPTLIIFKKLGLHYLGIGRVGNIVVYFLAPTITILLTIIFGKFLKKRFPHIYPFLTGSR